MTNWVCRSQLGRGPVTSRTGRLRAALHKDTFVRCNPIPASGGADVSTCVSRCVPGPSGSTSGCEGVGSLTGGAVAHGSEIKAHVLQSAGAGGQEGTVICT